MSCNVVNVCQFLKCLTIAGLKSSSSNVNNCQSMTSKRRLKILRLLNWQMLFARLHLFHAFFTPGCSFSKSNCRQSYFQIFSEDRFYLIQRIVMAT